MTTQAGPADLIWQRPEPVTPPGRPTARPAEIAAAAFEIADREGLHAVSVKRVAKRLKVSLAALEDYVVGRDDLLDLMLDAAFAEMQVPPAADGEDWRADLRALAYATQAVAMRHPWLCALAGTRTPSGPNGLRVNERILAAVDGLGLTPVEATQMANAVLAFVYGFVQLEMGHVPRGRDAEAEAEHKARTARYLIERTSSGDYPNLARLFADSADLAAHTAFDAGLDLVLDGIRLRIDAAPEPAGAAGAKVRALAAKGTQDRAPESAG